jgi:hypothetical protein
VNAGAAQTAPLLTIGIPTYNRAATLRRCLARLLADLEPHATRVEVIVSDNASPDDTGAVLREAEVLWQGRVGLRYTRQEHNVGVSRNVVALFHSARSRYFMFLGDDDCLSAPALPRLLSALDSGDAPVAVIQTRWNGRTRVAGRRDATWTDALALIYEYGNAWAGVVDVAAACRAIESRGLRDAVESIVWPQTVMGFLAMYDSSPRPVCLQDVELGGPLVPGLNIHNKAYWIRSLGDLLRAATIIDAATGGHRARRALSSPANPGLKGHIRSIAWEALLEEGGPSTQALRVQLCRDFGIRGRLWAAALAVTDKPALLWLLGRTAALLRKGMAPWHFDERLAARQRERSADITTRARGGRRFGDWF